MPHVLHMAGCGLYSDGLACAIASALPFNSTLTRLSLRRQRIGAHWRETCFKRVRRVRVVHHVRTSSDVCACAPRTRRIPLADRSCGIRTPPATAQA